MATVLVVDDDVEIREALRDVLEAQGYEVAVARDGLEALGLLRTSPLPCLILLDLMMPIMDGHEFLKQQKQDPALADVPVVIITAGRHLRSSSGIIDACDVLHKPFAREKLLSTVQQFCG